MNDTATIVNVSSRVVVDSTSEHAARNAEAARNAWSVCIGRVIGRSRVCAPDHLQHTSCGHRGCRIKIQGLGISTALDEEQARSIVDVCFAHKGVCRRIRTPIAHVNALVQECGSRVKIESAICNSATADRARTWGCR